jgi:hypothetical protein
MTFLAQYLEGSMGYDPLHGDMVIMYDDFAYDIVHDIEEEILEKALDSMEGAAAEFIKVAEVDSSVRFSYVQKIAEMRNVLSTKICITK